MRYALPSLPVPAAGNEVHAALSKCLPPVVTLQCLPVAWLPGGLLELEITGKHCCPVCSAACNLLPCCLRIVATNQHA
jgi:hypothetical protein